MNRLRLLATLVCTVFILSLVLIPLSVQAASSTTTVQATKDSGGIVNLAISGNITSSQMTNVEIATNQSAKTATLSFTLIGGVTTTGFSNITIPKSAVSYGTKPNIYVDNKPISSNQGSTQDSNNYYVWYTASFSNFGQSIGFSTHQVSIILTQTSSSPSPTPTSTSTSGSTENGISTETWIIIAIVGAIVVVLVIVMILRKAKSK